MMRFDDLVAAISSLQRSDLEAWIREQLVLPQHEAGKLLFTADTFGNLLALDPADGRALWHVNVGRMAASPMTYEMDGRQYLLFAIQDILYAFTLPR